VKLSLLARAPQPSPTAPGSLVVETAGKSTTYTVQPGQHVTLGRDRAADVVVDDARVSPRHVLIARLGPGWLVTSLDAANPAMLLDPTGRSHPVDRELGLRTGELVVGGSLVKLYRVAP